MFGLSQELFIKISGITNAEDAQVACSLGANAISFNFMKSDKRYVAPELASLISGKLPEYVSKIGVFENADDRYIKSVLKRVPLSAVQLKGNYAPDDLVGYETSVIRAFSIDRSFEVEKLRNYLVDAFLLENESKEPISTKPREFHWDIALKAKEFGRIIISGGLNPDNIEDAVRFVQPYGIDVCEGIERTIGKKDPDKMRNFISRSRGIIVSYHDDEEN